MAKMKKKAKGGALELEEPEVAYPLPSDMEERLFRAPGKSGEAEESALVPEKLPESSLRIMKSRGLTEEQVRERALKGSTMYYLDYLQDAESSKRNFDLEVQERLVKHAAYHLDRLRMEAKCGTFREMADWYMESRHKKSKENVGMFARLESMRGAGEIPKEPVYAKGELTPLDDLRLRDNVSRYAGYLENAENTQDPKLRDSYEAHALFMLRIFRDQMKLDSFAGLAKYADTARHGELVAALDNSRFNRVSPKAPKTELAEREIPRAEKKAPLSAAERKWMTSGVSYYANLFRQYSKYFSSASDPKARKYALHYIRGAIAQLEAIRAALGAKLFRDLGKHAKSPDERNLLAMMDKLREQGKLTGSELAKRDMEARARKWLEDGVSFYAKAFRDFSKMLREEKSEKKKEYALHFALHAARQLEAIRRELGLKSGKELEKYAQTKEEKGLIARAERMLRSSDEWDSASAPGTEVASAGKKPGKKKAASSDLEWFLGGVETYVKYLKYAESLKDSPGGAAARTEAIWRLEEIRRKVGKEKFNSELAKQLKNAKVRNELVARLDALESSRQPAAEVQVAKAEAPKEPGTEEALSQGAETMVFEPEDVGIYEESGQGKPLVPRGASAALVQSEEARKQFVADTMARLAVEDTSHYLRGALEAGMKAYGFENFAQMAEYAERKSHQEFLRSLGEISDVQKFLAEAKRQQPWKQQG